MLLSDANYHMVFIIGKSSYFSNLELEHIQLRCDVIPDLKKSPTELQGCIIRWYDTEK